MQTYTQICKIIIKEKVVINLRIGTMKGIRGRIAGKDGLVEKRKKKVI